MKLNEERRGAHLRSMPGARVPITMASAWMRSAWRQDATQNQPTSTRILRRRTANVNGMQAEPGITAVSRTSAHCSRIRRCRPRRRCSAPAGPRAPAQTKQCTVSWHTTSALVQGGRNDCTARSPNSVHTTMASTSPSRSPARNPQRQQAAGKDDARARAGRP